MPAKQRPRCDDKGPPAGTRQKPAGSREEEPVAPRHRRTAGSSPEDAEFVPKHDDFQLLEIVRPKAPGSKLQNPPNHQITEGEEHRSLLRSQTAGLFYAMAPSLPHTPAGKHAADLYTLHPSHADVPRARQPPEDRSAPDRSLVRASTKRDSYRSTRDARRSCSNRSREPAQRRV